MINDSTEFFDVTFENKDFFEKDLSDRIFDETIFRNCDLSQADLRFSSFNNCTFENSNFSMPLLEGSSFNSVEFRDCKITGTLFSLLKKKLLLQMNFSACNIVNCDFSGLPLKGIKITDCRISESDFIECDLRSSCFSGSSFNKVRMENSDLSAADFRNCSNIIFDITKNRVKGTKISCEYAASFLEILGIITE